MTIPNKQPLKDRESPIKSRKQKEQISKDVTQSQISPQFKEAIPKEASPSVLPEKIVKEEIVKNKENVAIIPQTIPATTVVISKESKEATNLSQKEESKKNQRKEKSTTEQKIAASSDVQESSGGGSPASITPAVATVSQEFSAPAGEF